MNIYDAIMKAADWIERHPDQFRFTEVSVPDCGTPGCALGWIGHFAGSRINSSFRNVATDVLRLVPEASQITPDVSPTPDSAFYNRMDALCTHRFFGEWRNNATVCADTLRLYAAKYHASKRNFARELYEKVSVAPRIPENA